MNGAHGTVRFSVSDAWRKTWTASAFVGAGAVGGYTCTHMVQAGEDVTFIDPWPAWRSLAGNPATQHWAVWILTNVITIPYDLFDRTK